jgi:MFS family permease
MPRIKTLRSLRAGAGFTLALLTVEFLDEFVFGAREAAWPLIRTDLGLSYVQIGLLLSVPNLVSSVVEPALGILADMWNRRVLILAGGLFFALSLLLTVLSADFWLLLASFVLFYPASGALVSLSQATLMDIEPARHEHNMARWTLAGSVGVVAGPLVLSLAALLGWSWRAPSWLSPAWRLRSSRRSGAFPSAHHSRLRVGRHSGTACTTPWHRCGAASCCAGSHC